MAGLLVWHRAKHYVLPRKFEGFKEGTMNTLYGIYHSVDAVENFSSQVKAEAVNEEVSSRCLHLMKQVHSSALRKPVIEHVLTTKDLEYTNVTLEEGAMSFEEQQRSFILGLKGMETLRERLVESVGYVVERRKSIIPGAGWGLFVRGKALPGDVIAFVPGTIYLPIEQRWLVGYPDVKNDKLFLSLRPDHTIIDSDDVHGMKQYSLATWDEAERKMPNPFWEWHNVYASGHYANHPPKGMHPKVISCPVELENEVLVRNQIRRFAPYMRPQTNFLVRNLLPKMLNDDSDDIIHGMVLIATEEIDDGEEVFRNYRFNPQLKNIPEWFEDPDPENTKRLYGIQTEAEEEHSPPEAETEEHTGVKHTTAHRETAT